MDIFIFYSKYLENIDIHSIIIGLPIDIYKLSINPENDSQYLFDDKWKNFEIFDSSINIKLLKLFNIKFVYSPISSLGAEHHSGLRSGSTRDKITWDTFLQFNNDELNITESTDLTENIKMDLILLYLDIFIEHRKLKKK